MATRRAAAAAKPSAEAPDTKGTMVAVEVEAAPPAPESDDISWQYPLLMASVFATCGSAVLIPFRQGRLDDLGCTKLCLGAVQSSRSALQLVGSPALGAHCRPLTAAPPASRPSLPARRCLQHRPWAGTT